MDENYVAPYTVGRLSETAFASTSSDRLIGFASSAKRRTARAVILLI